MKAINGKRAVIVGLFVIVGVIILMIGVFALGGQKKSFSNGIPIKAVFDNVSGLQAGNNIWFSGVKIGTVRKLLLVDGSKVEVDMNIDPKAHQFIRKDALAKIGSDGLIGNKIVILFGGTPQAPAIAPNDVLQNAAVVSNDDVMNTLQENNKNLLSITTNFKLISDHLAHGDGTVGKLLTNDDLANQLLATTTILQKASANIQSLTSNVASYTTKLKTKGVLANDLVSDTTLFASLRSTLAQVQLAANNAKHLTSNLDSVSQKINDSANTVGVLLHDEKAADNIKATVQNLQEGTQKFSENMEALQHNFLLRGFFRKKARKEKEQNKAVVDK